MPSETILKLISALVVATAFAFAWQLGRKYGLSRRPGWLNIKLGFGLTLLASLLVLTENHITVRRLLVIGGSDYRFYLTFGSYLFGFVSLLIGGWKWLPALLARKQSDELADAYEQLQRESVERRRAEENLRESEARYRGLVEHAVDGIFVIDLEGKIVDVNQRACDSLGVTRAEILEMFIWDFSLTVTPQVLAKVVKRLSSEGSVTLERVHRRKDGTTFPVEVRTGMLPLKGRQVLLGLARDITDRKRAEEVLRESEKRYRQIIEEASDMVYSIDPDGYFTYSNPPCQKFSGYTKAETVGMHFTQLIPEEWQQRVQSTYLEQVQNRQQETVLEFPALTKTGEEKWVEQKVTLLFEKGEVIGLQSIVRDISDRKRAEEALRQSRLQLEETVERRTEELKGAVTSMEGEIAERKRAEREREKNLAHFQALIEHMEAGVLVETEDRKISFTNSSFCRIFSIPVAPEELVGFDCIDAAEQAKELLADPKVFPNRISEIIKRQGKAIGEEILFADGRIFERDYIPIRGTNSVFIANMWQYRDITERKRAEEALAVEEERLSTTLRSITDGVIATDISGNVILINHAAEELTGWSQEAALDRPLIEVFKATRAGQPLVLPLNEVLRGKVKSIQKPDSVLVSQDGKEHPFAGSLAPLGDREDQIVGLVLVFKDTSERQLLENEILRAQKLESLGNLASGLAHDFNNFLTSIMLGIATAKLKTEDNEEVQDLLTSAQQSITKASAITQQLLTFSRGGEPVKSGMHLQPLIEEAVKFSLHGRQVTARFVFPPDLWRVDIDSGQITQVANNLVLNAVQAMPEGGELTVSARNIIIEKDDSHESLAPGNYVRVDVQDEGPGIEPDIIASIFDPYFTTRAEGSGLGLFSCYSIVTRHGGWLTVSSPPKQGATFTFYLPIAVKASQGTTAGVGFKPGGGRVLVMDDDDMIRIGLNALLGELGYEVASTADGMEAIELYTSELDAGRPFDVVILDLTVPTGMGGAEAVKRLREIDPQATVIVSSGYANDPVMARYRQYGFQGILAKPFRPEDLSQVMDSAMTSARRAKAPYAVS